MTPRLAAAIVAAIAAPATVLAQAPGLRIFQPIGSFTTNLVDLQGNLVHSWPGTDNLTAHIAPDGTLLRGMQASAIPAPGQTGGVQRLAFDGTLLWDYPLNGPFEYGHHDLEPMPNGNVLVIVWDRYTVADAIAAGRDPATITGTLWLPDAILEIEQTGPTSGNVVWEWHLFDHVIQDFDPTKANFGAVANHPELIDINYPPTTIVNGDWNHVNGLDYDPIHDWIMISAHEQDEIYLIDHSTTTAEAAGHTGGARGRGGDILYRWGNPEAYRAGTALDKQLDGQHDPRFVPPGYPGAGHVTLFDNLYTATASAIYEIALPLDASGNIVLDPVTGRYGPTAPLWTFTEPGFFSAVISSAERLPNGNTLICSGTQNRLFEVTTNGQTVWSYVHPGSAMVFQANYVARTLWNDTDELSVGGGQIGFDHLAGSTHGGRLCLLLGSLSGTGPGTPVPGGLTLPLNVDFLTSAMVTQWNTGIFVDTLRPLGSDGDGASAVVVPPGFVPPALIGATLHFAHVVYDSALFAVRVSKPVAVTIVP